MATDPKKDQKDQPERIAESGKFDELSEEQIEDVAGGRGPNDGLPQDQRQAPRHD